jgi:hypothetical protein
MSSVHSALMASRDIKPSDAAQFQNELSPNSDLQVAQAQLGLAAFGPPGLLLAAIITIGGLGAWWNMQSQDDKTLIANTFISWYNGLSDISKQNLLTRLGIEGEDGTPTPVPGSLGESIEKMGEFVRDFMEKLKQKIDEMAPEEKEKFIEELDRLFDDIVGD